MPNAATAVAAQMPWGPVVLFLSFAIMPGGENNLIIGTKTLRDKLGFDIMRTIAENRARIESGLAKSSVLGPGASSGELREGSHRVVSLRKVSVNMAGVVAVGVSTAAPEPPDEFHEGVLECGPAMFLEARDELEAREQALVAAVQAAGEAGLAPEYVNQLRAMVLERRAGAFRRVLTGEPAVAVEPLRVTLKPDFELRAVKAKPRPYSPEKTAWLTTQLDKLMEAGMVICKIRKLCVQE